jgi:hypothetical protein
VVPPPLASVHASPFRADLEQEWGNMLAHQLPMLAPLAQFWGGLDGLFGWLDGAAEITQPAPLLTIPGPPLDTAWRPSPKMTMTNWRSGGSFDTVRFAGANRLKVRLDYRAASGRRGSYVVEPHSLRRTKDGDLFRTAVH